MTLSKLALKLSNQATLSAFVDAFWVIAAAFLIMIPLVFMLKKVKYTGHTSVH